MRKCSVVWLVLALAPQSAGAKLAAASYEAWTAPAPQHLPTLEATTLAAVRAYFHAPLSLDPRLREAAYQIAARADGTDPLPALRQAASQRGVTDSQLAAITATFELPAHDAPRAWSAQPGPALSRQVWDGVGRALDTFVRGTPTNRVGVGLAATRLHDVWRLQVCVALAQHLVQLAPVPTHLPAGSLLRLDGLLLAQGSLTLAVQNPGGEVWQRPVAATPRFASDIDLAGAEGVYWLELLLDRGDGPTQASLLAVQVGDAELPEARRGNVPRHGANTLRQVAQLVLGTRASFELPLLPLHPTLQQTAQRRAEWLAARSTISHDADNRHGALPLSDRLGGHFVRLHENIALAADGGAALVQWMASPAHRAALLATDVDVMGIGMTPSWRADGSKIFTLLLGRDSDS